MTIRCYLWTNLRPLRSFRHIEFVLVLLDHWKFERGLLHVCCKTNVAGDGKMLKFVTKNDGKRNHRIYTYAGTIEGRPSSRPDGPRRSEAPGLT